MLTREEARRTYDILAPLVRDSETPYGRPAAAALLAKGAFDAPGIVVVEFGCGPGLLAARLLARHASVERYAGVDQSEVMCEMARERLAGDARASVTLTSGDPADVACAAEPGTVDRFVSSYVLDLLSEDDVRAVLSAAAGLLKQNGLLCLAGLTYGDTALRKAVAWVWGALHAALPQLVGGCRPQVLEPYVLHAGFELVHRETVAGAGLTSEVLVARKV